MLSILQEIPIRLHGTADVGLHAHILHRIWRGGRAVPPHINIFQGAQNSLAIALHVA